MARRLDEEYDRPLPDERGMINPVMSLFDKPGGETPSAPELPPTPPNAPTSPPPDRPRDIFQPELPRSVPSAGGASRNAQSAPARPSTPTPVASQRPIPSVPGAPPPVPPPALPSGGFEPFSPLPATDFAALATPTATLRTPGAGGGSPSNIYGGAQLRTPGSATAEGQYGGGLAPGQYSSGTDPISRLIALLLGQAGGENGY